MSQAGHSGEEAAGRAGESQSASVLLALVPSLISSSAQHEARLASLERATSDEAGRTEGRISALAGQIQHLDDRLDAQDTESARQWQRITSALGAVQASVGQLQATEQQRAAAAAQAALEARERHKDSIARLHRIAGGILLFVASSVWPLLAGLSVPRRLLALALGCALAAAYSVIAYYRARAGARAP